MKHISNMIFWSTISLFMLNLSIASDNEVMSNISRIAAIIGLLIVWFINKKVDKENRSR